jgi:hypothetical protein
VVKFIHFIVRTDLVRGEMCVTGCVVVRGIERGKVYTFDRGYRGSYRRDLCNGLCSS